jgi:hypothetical protein
LDIIHPAAYPPSYRDASTFGRRTRSGKETDMINRRALPEMMGVVLVLSFTVGCGAPAVSLAATGAPSEAMQPSVASGTPEGTGHALIIPVGRTAVVGGNAFQVLIDSEPYDPQATFDGYGGYWIEVPFDPQNDSRVALRFTINSGQKGLYREEGEDREKWLRPSELIDSDTPALMAEAERLTVNGGTAVEKARSIHEFVIGYLTFKPYGRHFLTGASDTYRLGYGTCVNYARLFTALSRAAGVPARTVWGVTLNNGEYEHHHEWAEFLDDEGYWHPLDLTYTTSFALSDINYLDLIYASEENPLFEKSQTEQYSEQTPRFIIYDTTDQPYDGRLGFTFVENNYPESYVVENVFVLADLPGLIPQRVP